MSGALPSAMRRARSCRVCTARKCARSSGHLISSRASFDRVATVATVLLCADGVSIARSRGWEDGRLRCNVQETGGVDGVQSVSERDKGGALREEHKEAVQTFEQIRVSVRL
jgi:hypothetical protein